jgi:uncharacterized protein
VDARGRSDDTPLVYAALSGRRDVAALLLNHGANPNAASLAGVTPLIGAAHSGSVDTVRLLLQHGALPVAECHGTTPRDVAEMGGHSGVVELLDRWPN